MGPPQALRKKRETRASDKPHGQDHTHTDEVESLIGSIGKQVQPGLADVDQEMRTGDKQDDPGREVKEGREMEEQSEYGRVGYDMGKQGMPLFAFHRGHPGVLEAIVSEEMASKKEKVFCNEKEEDRGHGTTSFLRNEL